MEKKQAENINNESNITCVVTNIMMLLTNKTIDNSMMITREKGGLERVKEGKRGVNGDRRKLDLGCKYTIKYTDDIL